MSFKINELVNDTGDHASTVGGEKFKTPRLPPVEELTLLKFWKVMLDMYEFEAEVVATHGKPILELVTEKMIEKECPNLNLINALRSQLGLGAPSSAETGHAARKTAKSKQSKSSLSSATSNSNSLGSSLGPQKLNSYRRMYAMSTRDFHPDELLLRFLVQQDWDIGMAFMSLNLTGLFRIKWDLDGFMKSGEEGALLTLDNSKNKKDRQVAQGFLKQCRIGKSFVHGSDGEGRPIVITRMRLNEVNDQGIESIKKYILWQIECGRLMLGPAATDVISVWDFRGVRMDNLHPSVSRFLVDAFQKYFPGAFYLILLHNVPKFFEKTWDVMKGWLNAQGAAKIKFTRTVDELAQYVPRDKIIQELGGDDPWEFSYIPVQGGENDLMKQSELEKSVWEEYDELWIKCHQLTRKMVDLAASGLDYSQVKTQRNDLVTHMRVSYWRLDPFIRARSYYDRMGLIGFRRESAFMTVALTGGRQLTHTQRPRAEEFPSYNSSREAISETVSEVDDDDDGYYHEISD